MEPWIRDRARRMALLVPRDGWSLDGFWNYWRFNHGPLVATTPQYGQFRDFYAQNYVVGDGPIGRSFSYAGAAEALIPTAPDLPPFATTDQFLSRILPDEEKFLNRSASIGLDLSDFVLIRGQGAVKLIVVSGRNSTLSHSEFRSAYLRHGQQIRESSSLASRLRGWLVGFVESAPCEMSGRKLEQIPPIDCVETFWFDDLTDMAFVCTQLDGPNSSLANLFSPARESFIAAEAVFFKDGLPQTPGPVPPLRGLRELQ